MLTNKPRMVVKQSESVTDAFTRLSTGKATRNKPNMTIRCSITGDGIARIPASAGKTRKFLAYVATHPASELDSIAFALETTRTDAIAIAARCTKLGYTTKTR